MIVLVYLAVGILFLLILISLGAEPKWMKRVMGSALIFVAVAGVGFYGYAYYELFGAGSLAIARTLFSVFCMFLGRNEIGTISQVPALQSGGMQVFIYFVHWMALYCMAGALISALGTKVVRLLYLFLLHRGDITLIFGVNEDSLSFAGDLKKGALPVFLTPDGSNDQADRIMQTGGILLNDIKTDPPEISLLRRLGIRRGKRRVSLYCLDESTDRNLLFAEEMRKLFEKKGLKPEQLELTAFLEKEDDGDAFQAVPGQETGQAGETKAGRYGYGTVLALEKHDLAARVMIRTYPPYKTMSFDAAGKAVSDFEAVIVGLGSTGQAVLRSLIMNGQFEGSRFHALVIAQKYEDQAGSFFFRCPGIRDNYDIEFIDASARSEAVYRALDERRGRIRYVAVCTGNAKSDSEIIRAFTDYFAGTGVPVICCSTDTVSTIGSGGIIEKTGICSPDILCGGRIDKVALVLNHQYHLQEGKTPEEDWAACDYFSRMSCRASADFMDAVLYSAGVTKEEAAQGWKPEGKLLENLGRTEHLRWCAFHYAMGYLPMPEEDFEKGAAAYLDEVKKTGRSSIRFTKDTVKKYHACLTGWDELTVLAEKEAAVTGVRKDYRQLDYDNILMIPEMLKKAE